jgi:hypothetical protein
VQTNTTRSWARNHQDRPDSDEDEHPDGPGTPALGKHSDDGVENAGGGGQAEDQEVVSRAVPHHVAHHRRHQQHRETQVDRGVNPAQAA